MMGKNMVKIYHIKNHTHHVYQLDRENNARCKRCIMRKQSFAYHLSVIWRVVDKFLKESQNTIA